MFLFLTFLFYFITFFTPPSGPVSSNTHFFVFTQPLGRGIVIPVSPFVRSFVLLLFLVVTCPVFARPNKCGLQTFGQHQHYLRLTTPICHNPHERRCRKLLGMHCNENLFYENKDKDASKLRKAPIRSGYLDQSKTNKVKYSTVKCKHCLAVLFCFAKISREIMKKSTRNSTELTSLRREQGRRC